jgi:flagellar M-ring protein FliF
MSEISATGVPAVTPQNGDFVSNDQSMSGATQDQSSGSFQTAGDRSMQPATFGSNDFTNGFLKLPWVRQLGLMAGVASILTFAVLLVIWSQDPEYKPLYSKLDAAEATKVAQVLEAAGLSFIVEAESGMVLVPAGELHAARMQVAASDILDSKVEGYLLLDQEQVLGTSQFMETARYRRAIEGELARTITSINSIRSARVLLAIPKRSVFVRDARKPSASVFIELSSGRDLKSNQVKAIMQLVANSVSEMSTSDVSIVDHKGNLLSDIEDESILGATEKQFQFSQKIEKELSDKINRILKPILGETKYNSQVSADIDFTWVEETQEMFNPDLPAVRSEETMEELRTGSVVGGIPGALSNEPPGAAAVPEQAGAGGGEGADQTRRQRKQATRNYELDRSISHTRHQVGRTSRLTVAVVIDDMQIANPETGVFESTPWPPETIKRLTVLVQDAIGFDQNRGDRVTIANESFLQTEQIEIVELGFWTEPWFIAITKQVIVALLVIFLTFFALRPVLGMLAGPSAEDRMKELLAGQELERLAEAELEQEEMMQETVTLSGGEALFLPGPGEVYARQLDTIKNLVQENPGRVAQVVKAWIDVGN